MYIQVSHNPDQFGYIWIIIGFVLIIYLDSQTLIYLHLTPNNQYCCLVLGCIQVFMHSFCSLYHNSIYIELNIIQDNFSASRVSVAMLDRCEQVLKTWNIPTKSVGINYR